MTIEEKIAGLPKWAREHIATLQRQRDDAVRHYHDQLDEQTPSSFYTEDLECVSGNAVAVKRYIQTNSVHCMIDGLDVNMRLREGMKYVTIEFEVFPEVAAVAIMPECSNAIRIIKTGVRPQGL